MGASERELAPLATWEAFVNAQVARNKTQTRGHGRHRLFAGQTQAGKTTLNRILLRMKKTVLVIGTKPKDSSLDRYVEEGYLRIDHWPPTKKELRQRGPHDQVKLLLWPKVTRYEDLGRHADLFRRAVRDVTVEGGWTLSVDEGLYVCSRRGLNLGEEISQLAFGGASNGLSLHLVIQRPAGIPVITYASCHDAYLFKMGNTNDIREIASYTGYETTDVARAIRGLNRGNPTKGHQFLYAPMTGGATWEVSEVPQAWA